MLALLLKETKSTTIKRTIHSKIDNERFTYITVSGFLLKRSFAGFPKTKKPLKLTLTYQVGTNICDNDKYLNNFTVFEHVTDENNDMTPTPNFIAS